MYLNVDCEELNSCGVNMKKTPSIDLRVGCGHKTE